MEYISAYTGSIKTLMDLIKKELGEVEVDKLEKGRSLGDKLIIELLKRNSENLLPSSYGITNITGAPYVCGEDSVTGQKVCFYIDNEDKNNLKIGRFVCLDSVSPLLEFDAAIEAPEIPDYEVQDKGFIPYRGVSNKNSLESAVPMDRAKFIKRLRSWFSKQKSGNFWRITSNPTLVEETVLLDDVVAYCFLGDYEKITSKVGQQYFPPTDFKYVEGDVPAIQVKLQDGIYVYLYLEKGKVPNVYIPLQGNWYVLPDNIYHGTMYPPLIDQEILTLFDVKNGVSWQEGLRRVGAEYEDNDPSIPRSNREATLIDWLNSTNQVDKQRFAKIREFVNPGSLEGATTHNLFELLAKIESFQRILVVKDLMDLINAELFKRSNIINTVWLDETDNSLWRVSNTDIHNINYLYLIDDTKQKGEVVSGWGDKAICESEGELYRNGNKLNKVSLDDWYKKLDLI